MITVLCGSLECRYPLRQGLDDSGEPTAGREMVWDDRRGHVRGSDPRQVDPQGNAGELDGGIDAQTGRELDRCRSGGVKEKRSSCGQKNGDRHDVIGRST